MFSENNKITGKQIKKMLIFDMLSISVLTVPGIAVKGAGRDGISAVVIGSMAALLYGCFFLFISKKVKGDYLEYAERALGRAGAFLIGILYIIKILISCWFTLSLFCNVLLKTLLPNTNYNVIILSFILIGCYMAVKGIEARARVSEVLFYIVVIPLFFIFTLGLKNVEITNLFPLFTADRTDVAKTSYAVILTFSSLEFLLFALPFVTDAESKAGKHRKGVMKAIAVTGILNVIFFILILGMLGIKEAGMQFDSSIAILQVIELPVGFLQRQDALILMLWLFSIFTIISAYFYYLSRIAGGILHKKSRYGYLAVFGISAFLLCMVRMQPGTMTDYYIKYMAYIGLPQSILIPLLIIFAARLRRISGNEK